MITREQNTILKGKHGRPFLADVFYEKNGIKKPVVIFSHGYRGFKDWGPFNLIAHKFAESGLVFVKFSFSHNGTTVDNPMEFVDLEAFGNDNITIELDDLSVGCIGYFRRILWLPKMILIRDACSYWDIAAEGAFQY